MHYAPNGAMALVTNRSTTVFFWRRRYWVGCVDMPYSPALFRLSCTQKRYRTEFWWV